MDTTAQKTVRSEAARKANVTRRQHMAMFVKALENMGIRKDYGEKEYYTVYHGGDGHKAVMVFSGGDSHDFVVFYFVDGSFSYMAAVVEPDEEEKTGASHED